MDVDDLPYLRRQLENKEETLLLIQERKSEYTLSTDIPLDLIREERDVQEEIAQLQAQIKALEQSPPPAKAPAAAAPPVVRSRPRPVQASQPKLRSSSGCLVRTLVLFAVAVVVIAALPRLLNRSRDKAMEPSPVATALREPATSPQQAQTQGAAAGDAKAPPVSRIQSTPTLAEPASAVAGTPSEAPSTEPGSMAAAAQAAGGSQIGSTGASQAPVATAARSPAAIARGTVIVEQLNVREQPSVSANKVGSVRAGARVEIVDRQPGWLQIRFENAPGARGWISSQYVRVDGEAMPKPTPTRAPQVASSSAPAASAGVPAPKAISYEDPTFRWEWSGLNQVAGQDWYFDILFFKSNAQDPYEFMVGEPALTKHDGNAWRFDRTKKIDILCDSYWTVQIAKRVNGSFAGWVSPKSNRLPIGKACPAEGGGAGVEPTATPCVGCGG